MKRTNITFSQLDHVLRAFGFRSRPGERNPRGHIYEHEETGARVSMRPYRSNEHVYEHHLFMARSELDNFGIADPKTFDATIQKAG